jgi:hypothetical protein
MQLYFTKNSVQCSYTDLVLGMNKYYFIGKSYHSNKTFYELYIINILDLLIRIFVYLACFQQAVNNPMGTNYDHLITELCLDSSAADYKEGLLKKTIKQLHWYFHSLNIRY